ncbi:MAG TPA: hypothetical protein DEA51_07000 [Erysipelotrichaceae bacterium]|nr:hypothetical protein [Erysipelotrichaceae bacterium]
MERIKFGWITFVIVLLWLGATPLGFYQANKLQARGGEIYLSNVNQQNLYQLSGEWLFTSNSPLLSANFSSAASKTVNVPHYFAKDKDMANHGVGSYQLVLYQLDPSAHYMMYLSKVPSAYNLYVNKKEITGSGRVSNLISTYQPQFTADTAVFMSDANGKAVIQLEVSDFDTISGGLTVPIYFAHADTMVSAITYHQIIETLVISLLVMVGIFFGLFHLVYEEDRSLVFMMGLMWLTALFTLFHYDAGWSIFLQRLPWTWTNRFYYMSIYSFAPLLLWMIDSMPLTKQRPSIRLVAQIWLSVVAVITLTLPNQIYAGIESLLHLVSLVAFMYLLIELLLSIIRKQEYAFILFASIGFVLYTYVDMFILLNLSYLFPFALLALGLTYSLHILTRFLMIRRLNKRLEEDVSTDLLTGCKNRFALQRVILSHDMSSQSSKKQALLFLDLNDFKMINDQYSHDVGDAILRVVGSRLRSAVRNWGEVYRYGGDEFVLIVGMSENQSIEDMYQKISYHFKQPVIIGTHTFYIKYSLGYSLVDDTHSMEKSLHISDQKMYEHKQSKKKTAKQSPGFLVEISDEIKI